ncbi:MAG: hypothetical protein OEY79_04460 [Anaplasmataceae bacterium]|nr:hypothetical protein [Anaplasmataceae bacterium]
MLVITYVKDDGTEYKIDNIINSAITLDNKNYDISNAYNDHNRNIKTVIRNLKIDCECLFTKQDIDDLIYQDAMSGNRKKYKILLHSKQNIECEFIIINYRSIINTDDNPIYSFRLLSVSNITLTTI